VLTNNVARDAIANDAKLRELTTAERDLIGDLRRVQRTMVYVPELKSSDSLKCRSAPYK
jgi:hypothetical protein